jgi:hypothetical protein
MKQIEFLKKMSKSLDPIPDPTYNFLIRSLTLLHDALDLTIRKQPGSNASYQPARPPAASGRPPASLCSASG